jgi:hypothetical protein
VENSLASRLKKEASEDSLVIFFTKSLVKVKLKGHLFNCQGRRPKIYVTFDRDQTVVTLKVIQLKQLER